MTPTKEQIDATPTELDWEVPAELLAEINNFLYVYDWVDVLSESELASLRIQLVHFMSNREAQAHAAGVRDGIEKAAKVNESVANNLYRNAEKTENLEAREHKILMADSLVLRASEIRALIKE